MFVEYEAWLRRTDVMKKIIVFGGAGFLGSHTADMLTEKGYDVIVF